MKISGLPQSSFIIARFRSLLHRSVQYRHFKIISVLLFMYVLPVNHTINQSCISDWIPYQYHTSLSKSSQYFLNIFLYLLMYHSSSQIMESRLSYSDHTHAHTHTTLSGESMKLCTHALTNHWRTACAAHWAVYAAADRQLIPCHRYQWQHRVCPVIRVEAQREEEAHRLISPSPHNLLTLYPADLTRRTQGRQAHWLISPSLGNLLTVYPANLAWGRLGRTSSLAHFIISGQSPDTVSYWSAQKHTGKKRHATSFHHLWTISWHCILLIWPETHKQEEAHPLISPSLNNLLTLYPADLTRSTQGRRGTPAHFTISEQSPDTVSCWSDQKHTGRKRHTHSFHHLWTISWHCILLIWPETHREEEANPLISSSPDNLLTLYPADLTRKKHTGKERRTYSFHHLRTVS